MKVLLAADIFPPQIGGPATYVVALANSLTQRGDEVKIVSLNPAGKQISPITYHISRNSKVGGYLEYFLLLYKHAKTMDVIYAMGPVNAGLPALIVSRLRRKPLVTKVVGDYAWEQGVERFGITATVEEFQRLRQLPWPVRWRRSVERFVVRQSNGVIVPSCYLKNLITKWWGLNWHAVCVVYNAVDGKGDEQSLVKPVEEQWILSVGRLVPWKGFNTLIEIMPEIVKQCPGARLKIIGDGPERENLRSKIKNLKSVDLLGPQPQAVVYSYIKAAGVFILNSGYEGLSHVLLEALRAGIPVLASDAGGNPELIQPGQNGDLFRYNDKAMIKELVVSVLGGRRYEWDAAERAGFFQKVSLESMAKETRCMLENVCRKS